MRVECWMVRTSSFLPREQRCDFRTCLDGLHERGWEHSVRERCLDRAGESRGGTSRLLTALENRGVA
jgi:hypothetical protein